MLCNMIVLLFTMQTYKRTYVDINRIQNNRYCEDEYSVVPMIYKQVVQITVMH